MYQKSYISAIAEEAIDILEDIDRYHYNFNGQNSPNFYASIPSISGFLIDMSKKLSSTPSKLAGIVAALSHDDLNMILPAQDRLRCISRKGTLVIDPYDLYSSDIFRDSVMQFSEIKPIYSSDRMFSGLFTLNRDAWGINIVSCNKSNYAIGRLLFESS